MAHTPSGPQIDRFFQERSIRATPAQPAAAGQEPHSASLSENTDPDVSRKVLFGTDISKTTPPQATLHQPVAQFHNQQGQRFGITEELLSKHLLLLGGIGSGKTNVLNLFLHALLSHMTQEDILILFDTKGDYFQEFYDGANPNHIVIGNGAEYKAITNSWNMFDELRDKNGRFTKESELVAKEISLQFFRDRKSETQPFFADAAADLVSKVLVDFMRKYNRGEKRSLSTEDFVKFIHQSDAKAYLAMTQDPRNADFHSAQTYFGDPSRPTPQSLGVFSYINSMVNDLFVGIFAEKSSSGDVAMRQLVRSKGKKVVFIEYDLSVGEVLSPMYRLLFDLALKEALGRDRGIKGNVFLVIDEFKLLPDLIHIDDALNFGRSMGVKVCAGLQSINQLYDIYGEERGKVLAAGFMNSFCFQTWDLDSRKFISERFGETFELLNVHGKDMERSGHVVEDWDILNLEIGQAFVNLNGYKPFRYQFPEYISRKKEKVREGIYGNLWSD